MKKTLLASSLLTVLMASSAQADTLLGAKAGVDYWQASAKGDFSTNSTNVPEFNYDSGAQGSIWASLEHPIPLVPNVMLRENMVKETGHLGNATADVDLGNTDFILYYEILDNDLVSLDIGGAYKLLHGSYSISSGTSVAKQDQDDGVVMGYANAMVGVPGIGLFAFADIMAGLNKREVYDVRLGVGWQFDSMLADLRLRTGYREFNFDANDFAGVNSNMKFNGFFAGVELDF